MMVKQWRLHKKYILPEKYSFRNIDLQKIILQFLEKLIYKTITIHKLLDHLMAIPKIRLFYT